MYAVVESSASDSVYSSVVSLGASLAARPVASVGTCVDTSPRASPEDASLSFILESGASHCFFRDRTTLTPLPTPVSVALADPTVGPVTARYTTTLPCLAVPSGSLTSFHVPLFSRNLVGVRPLVSQHVGVWIQPFGETAVFVDGDTYEAGIYTLHTGPRGQQQQHWQQQQQQQLLPPTPVTVPRQAPTSHQVAMSPQVAVSGQVPVSSPLAASCSCQSLAHPTVLWQHRMGHPSISRLRAMSSLVTEIARTSMTHARAPHFLWPYAVRYATHHMNPWPRVSRPEFSPTSLWTGSPGAASRFRVWGCLALVRDTFADKISPRAEDSSDYTFHHPPLRRFFDSRDVRFDESVPYYVSSRGAGVGAESVPVRGPSSGGAGFRAEPVTAGDSSLRGAGVSGAVPGGATTGGAPSSGPGEPGGSASWGSLSSPPLPPPDPSPAVFPPPLPPLSPPLSHTWPLRRSPRARPSSPVPFTDLRTALFCSCPPRLSPSVLPSPPESALTASLSTLVIDYYCTYRLVLSRVLASLVTDPRASLSSVSALTAAFTEFASTRYLDYATSLVAAPPTSPLVIEGESALGCDALEDNQFELEFLAAASPYLCAMLLALEGDLDALDIPTPRTYAVAVSGPWVSQWRAAMDSKMASYRSTGTYVDEVPPLGANVVDGMWIFRVKWPLGSPSVFKVRYVARGFSQCKGVDFFQTFAPTPKMTTLRVLPHVAAQRDYELHSLDFSTAFLQGHLHEEVWLCCPSAFTGTFPPGTQWRLRRPVYGLRQAPREWHNTLYSTISNLGFQPSSVDPTLFVRRGSTPFFKRHTCTDLGELRHYLGLQITRDRAARTITLSQSHMMQQVLQRFELQHSTIQRTPLAIDHRLTRPFPDEPFELSGPYAELVGCLMYLMTCTRPDLAFLLGILARFVAPGRHRPVHWTFAVRVAKYLATTSGVGLVLGGRQDVVLTGHCDFSYADDAETHKSTHGYCFSLSSGAVSWRSTRSSSVLTSTAEAEIYAGAMAAQELRWVTFLLTDLSERPSSAPTLFTNNKATILLC
ncbi:unnamed protein product [Closterium sp. NIES-54]